jgi:acetylornithine deacetylase/succinyl-diaminopimelate desuccinylase-like protein
MKQKTTMNQWKARIENNRTDWMAKYFRLLSFASISTEADFSSSVIDCANWLEQELKGLGFNVEQWHPINGHPILFATYSKAGKEKPTLLIYNHYDVQPVDPVEAWDTPPFSPSLRNGEVYARGAQDNKGQLFYVLESLKLLIEETGTLPINIKLCIEGEEEIGSPSLNTLLMEKKDALKADYLAIVDLGMRQPQVPSLTLGIRGIVTLDVHVQGSAVDLHSGSHGGLAANPNQALIALLASLHDQDGRVTIPGFYDDIVELTPQEKEVISFHFDPSAYEKESGAKPVGGEKEYLPLERAWLRPTLEINGISGGYTGQGFKTVIPAHAHAKLSCRLVANQDPKKIGQLVANYLMQHSPQGVHISAVVHSGSGKSIKVSPHSTVVKAFSKAFDTVFGNSCEYIYEGASIPITAALAEVSGAETILLGLGLITDHIHAPNEHFGVDRLEKGMLVMAQAIVNLSEV